ncbi:hypothetical protein TorRG33x02_271470, partial [Trema orientale]
LDEKKKKNVEAEREEVGEDEIPKSRSVARPREPISYRTLLSQVSPSQCYWDKWITTFVMKSMTEAIV